MPGEGGKTTTRHNLIMVPGSTSISEQAALPTLKPDQRCLSFNMERASDIEGEQLTFKLLSFNVDAKLLCHLKKFQTESFKMVPLRVEQMT